MQLLVELCQLLEGLVHLLDDRLPLVDLQNFLLHELALVLARQTEDGLEALGDDVVDLEALLLELCGLLLLPLEPVGAFLGVVDPLVGLELLLQALDGGVDGLPLLLVDLPILEGAWWVDKELGAKRVNSNFSRLL